MQLTLLKALLFNQRYLNLKANFEYCSLGIVCSPTRLHSALRFVDDGKFSDSGGMLQLIPDTEETSSLFFFQDGVVVSSEQYRGIA